MPELDPVFAIEAQALSQILDELDYFQVLKIEQGATAEQIKQAYFRESRLYHPDQFYASQDVDLRQAVGKIYKRVNEAFVVLRDDRKRSKYTSDVNGPNRERKLRYTEESEEELKRQRDQEMGSTPQARKTFQAALLDLDSGRYQQALLNLKLAMQFEPQNAYFKQKYDEAQRLAGARK